MVNVSFVCRSQKVNRLGTAPVEMTVNTGGKRVYVALDLRCRPEDFKIAMSGGGNTHILEYVAACRKRIDLLIVKYTEEGIDITADSLKKGFNSITKAYVLDELFGEYLTMVKKRVGREISNDTYQRYERAIKLFYKANEVPPTEPAKTISYSHFITFQTYLLSVMDRTTARNYLQKIKSIFKYGFETGKIPANPGYGLKIQKVEKDTVQYLTTDELNAIRNHKFGNRLQEVADCFLFSCYTGLSFSDIRELEPVDYKVERGFTYVNKRRKKTGIKFTAVLFEEALSIAAKYGYRLPVKSNQKTNEYLKEIGNICGIDKPLHFHMARHTAACYYINHRPALPDETIQRIFGWTNSKQLHHYAKLFNTTVFNDIEQAFGTMEAPRQPVAKPVAKDSTPELPEDDLEAFQLLLGINNPNP